MEPIAAWYVAHTLLGTPPPENAAGGRIAFKTGTSYGYRDAWSVGFDGKRTIGVWVGRPDGGAGAGPGRSHGGGADLVRSVCAARTSRSRRCRMRQKSTLMAATAKLPPPLQRFRPGGAAPSQTTRPGPHHVSAKRRTA